MEHHRLSPSSAHRWIACPASVQASAGFPDTRSDAAFEGSAAHVLHDYALRHDRPAAELIGTTVDVDGVSWTVDEEMAAHVQTSVDYVRSFPGALLVEQRFDLSPWIPGGFGTADALLVGDGVATLPDFKYGKGVRVHARENPQLMVYALGAWHASGYLYDVDLFRLVVSQPRLDHFDEWTIPVRDLLAWGDDVLRPAVALATGDAPPFTPAEDACRWCRAAPTCRALADHAMAIARQAFAQPPPVLTNAEVGELLARLPIVEQWAGKLREHAFAELSAGAEVPGWKLVEGRANRAWSDESTAAGRLVAAGATDDQIFVRKLISPTQAEKVLGRKHAALECVVKPAGKPTLAPDTDPRPPCDAGFGAFSP